jgi:hypothetical protein
MSVCFTLSRVWLLGATLLCSCVVRSAYPVAGPPRGYATVCRDPRATLLRLRNPGPGPVSVGHTLAWPGWTALCVPPGARRLVAVQVFAPAPGQAPQAVLTRDGRAVVGHPIAIVARGPASATATVNRRYWVALPMAFAGLSVQPQGPGGQMPDGQVPDGQGPGGQMPDGQMPGGQGPGGQGPGGQGPGGQDPGGPQASGEPAEPGETDSLWEAFQGVESPTQGDSNRAVDTGQR